MQVAHLVPKSIKDEWPSLPELKDLNNNPVRSTLEDTANGVTLRNDLHQNLDAFNLVFYPKGARLVTHFLSELDAETACYLFHNIPIRLHQQTSVGLVFARFMYNIFSRLTAPNAKFPRAARLVKAPSVRANYKRKRNKSVGETSHPASGSFDSASAVESTGVHGDSSAQFTRNDLHNLDGETRDALHLEYFQFLYPTLGTLYTVEIFDLHKRLNHRKYSQAAGSRVVR